MNITAIVPVYNGGTDLHRCLAGLAASQRAPDRVIVADDSSTDGAAGAAHEFGYERVTLAGGPLGPAVARNRGAALATTADILLFVDADVEVHTDTVAHIERYFEREPELAALLGSYDDDPPVRTMVSLYKNLLHHYVHQHNRREAATFWAGCGAVRRTAFMAVGGFDERYTRPSIEDIELGMRLHAAGYRIWSCPDVQGKHLKHWTLPGLLSTDIRCRALPWSRLLIQQGKLPNQLNLSTRYRFSAAAAWTLAVSLAAFWWISAGFWIAILAAIVFVSCEFDLLRFFVRRGGWRFGLAATGLQLLYYYYASGTFLFVFVQQTVANWRAKRGLDKQVLR